MPTDPTRLVIPGPRPPQPANIQQSLDAHYDTSNFKPAIVFRVYIGLFLALGAIAAVLWVLVGTLGPRPDSGAAATRIAAFGGPPLQPSPAHPNLPGQDAAAQRARAEHALNSYARLPGDPDHVQIPIAGAEEMLLSGQTLQNWPVNDTLPYATGADTQPARGVRPNRPGTAVPHLRKEARGG